MRTENIEFFALMEAAGWSQAEAARRLELDPSVISQYKSDKVRPSAQTLSLLKLILSHERPGALTAAGSAREAALADWERKVVEDLRWLEPQDRDRVVDAIHALTKGLPKRAPVQTQVHGVSSKVASVAEGSQASASAVARRENQEQQPKPPTGEPSGDKRGRGRGARGARG